MNPPSLPSPDVPGLAKIRCFTDKFSQLDRPDAIRAGTVARRRYLPDERWVACGWRLSMRLN